jgi:hypothetical protein
VQQGLLLHVMRVQRGASELFSFLLLLQRESNVKEYVVLVNDSGLSLGLRCCERHWVGEFVTRDEDRLLEIPPDLCRGAVVLCLLLL